MNVHRGNKVGRVGWALAVLCALVTPSPGAVASLWPTWYDFPGTKVIWSDAVEAEQGSVLVPPWVAGGASIYFFGSEGNDRQATAPWAFKVPDTTRWHSFSYTGSITFFPMPDDRDPRFTFDSAPLLTAYSVVINPTNSAAVSADGFIFIPFPSPSGYPVGYTSTNSSYWDPGHARFVGPYDRAYNGHYLMQYVLGPVDGIFYCAAKELWLADGAWFAVKPAPKPPVNTPAPPGGTGVSAPNKGELSINVNFGGRAVSGVPCTLTPSDPAFTSGSTLTQTTDSSGNILWHDLTPGEWSVVVDTSGLGPGTPTFKPATRTALVPPNRRMNLTVVLDGQGEANWQGGSDSASQGSGGWVGDALRWAIVPNPAKIEQLKTNLSALWHWGPVNLIEELVALKDIEHSAAVGIPLPLPTSLMGPHTGPDYVTFGDPGFAATSVWPIVRGIMGGGTYLTFALLVYRKLWPTFAI